MVTHFEALLSFLGPIFAGPQQLLPWPNLSCGTAPLCHVKPVYTQWGNTRGKPCGRTGGERLFTQNLEFELQVFLLLVRKHAWIRPFWTIAPCSMKIWFEKNMSLCASHFLGLFSNIFWSWGALVVWKERFYLTKMDECRAWQGTILKENGIFQPSIFRVYVSFQASNIWLI